MECSEIVLLLTVFIGTIYALAFVILATLNILYGDHPGKLLFLNRLLVITHAKFTLKLAYVPAVLI